jgi:long-chain acyl-CoA synthetase
VSTVERPAPATTTSLAALVRDRARETPDGVAVRSKRLGIWHEITWARYWHDVEQAAHALAHLGVGPGDRVAVLAENRYEWLVIDVATVAVRGVTVGVSPGATRAQVASYLADAQAHVVIAESSEQVDKVLAVRHQVPDLAHVCCLDPRGVDDDHADPRLRSWSAALEQRPEEADDVRHRMGEAAADDAVARFGAPGSAVTLSTRDVARAIADVVDDIAPSDRDVALPWHELADRAERLFATWLNAATGVPLHFAESVSTVPRDLREVQPTLVFAPARTWGLLAADIERRMEGATHLKRLVWRVWRPVAVRVGAARAGSGPPLSATTRVLWMAGRLVLYLPLRDRVGLRRVRHAATDDAVPAEVRAFFHGIGVPLRVMAKGAAWSV